MLHDHQLSLISSVHQLYASQMTNNVYPSFDDDDEDEEDDDDDEDDLDEEAEVEEIELFIKTLQNTDTDRLTSRVEI